MFLLEDISNAGIDEKLLGLISIFAIVSGILVIINKNPVKSVLFLIALFFTISLYLFGLNISFIALAYLLVYVGAVSILFLFILMLINVRVSELSTDNNNSTPLSIIIITIFSIAFYSKSLFTISSENVALLLINNNNGENLIANLFFVKETNDKVFLVFSCIWDNILNEMSHITSLGNVIYTSYSLGILIIGLILLLSMIGAISITVISNDRK